MQIIHTDPLATQGFDRVLECLLHLPWGVIARIDWVDLGVDTCDSFEVQGRQELGRIRCTELVGVAMSRAWATLTGSEDPSQ